MNEILSAIFPDSKIARNFIMARTKAMDAINHGIAPYFESLLLSNLNTSDIHINSQTCEMNRYVRYSDVACIQVKIRYFGSRFMGRGTYTDILQHFEEITKYLNPAYLYLIPWMGQMLIWNIIENLCKIAKMRIIIQTLGVLVYMLFTKAWELEWMIRSGA